jgi:dephospho-CoA kinase
MNIIGLTGGIASGKSTVAKILAEFGAEIIDADQIAREIVAPGEDAWQAIIQHFGNDILLPDRTIDRRKLGDIVFGNDEKRATLDRITHPAILARIQARVLQAEQAGTKVVVLDIPLMIEVGWQYLVQSLWLVYVDRETQLSRLQSRDKLTLSQAQARLAAQMPLEEKRKYADVIIDNGGSLEETKQQIQQAWKELS